MWRRQEEPKVSPTPQNVVSAPPAAVVPAPTTQANAQSTGQSSAQSSGPAIAQVAATKTATSIVCKGISIRGQISGSEDLQIDGEVSGTVQLPGGRVMIGPEGRVAGNIEAREIIVRGDLKGNLRAGERILVGRTGQWQGDGISPRLAIEDGAVVKGKLEVAAEVEKKPVAAKIAAVTTPAVAATSPIVPKDNGIAKDNGVATGGNGGGAGSKDFTHQNEGALAKIGNVPGNV